MAWWTRAIRPSSDEIPNGNPDAAPFSVGPPDATAGDPDGLVITGSSSSWVPPSLVPSSWSGWPADWQTPNWGGQTAALTDTAWACLDKNSSALASMPPYLVGAAPSLDAEWLLNPDPDIYSSVEEFLKQTFWDYQAVGEVFVLALSRYATGWPARFRVLPPWTVNIEMDAGRRRYLVGNVDQTAEILHVRYQGTTADAHGHGPLEAGAARLVAAAVLARYATNFAAAGGVPSSILEAPEELHPTQAAALRDQWVAERIANPGYPGVLTGGLKWTPTQIDPEKMALLELSQFNESRIAVLLGVPPFLVGLPSGGDSMTYANVQSIYDYHWRGGLRPMAQMVMSALSGWLLPRGTRVELNRDEYVQPGPYERAQTYQILNQIVDPSTGQPVMSVDEIRAAERVDNTAPSQLAAGVMR